MEEDNPFIEAFNKILFEEENNKKPSNQYILNDQNKVMNQDNNMLEDINQNIDNPIDQNEDIDMKSNNNSKEENENENNNNDDKLDINSLLGKKTKPDNDLSQFQESLMNNNQKIQNVNKIEPIKEYKSISVINNENKIEEYDYGYSIILLNEGETGLIEDFLNEKHSESTTADYFNFHLDEEKWIKILNHSIYIHYERHIKDEIEKRKKMQMYMNNGNNNPNPQMMAAMNPMNPMMIMNMGNMSNITNMSNGVNYQQMYLQNLKNMPNQFNLMNK